MGLNDTPSGERLHIGFFGRRNVGKSSLVNAVTGQELAVVSEVKGTTTDPVTKAMELLPLGPVVIIDTPGFDDEGELGEKRVERTRRILGKTDIAVLVAEASEGLLDTDRELLEIFCEKHIPYIIAYNKTDLGGNTQSGDGNTITVSAVTGANIHDLKEMLGRLAQKSAKEKRLLGDLLNAGDFAVLVTPIDGSAPKGRIILPQQQAIRDVLDAGAISIVTKETELALTLRGLGKPPAMVVTDSQAFAIVSEIVPDEIPLTSFSILMARYKRFLETAVAGVAAVRDLNEGDTVLVAEGCTHHRQCGDIGTVKIPRWLKSCTGKNLNIRTCSGVEFPDDLTGVSMVIHCGACMLNEREVLSRMERSVKQGVPFTNYGIFIAYATGTLERSLRLFPDIHALLQTPVA